MFLILLISLSTRNPITNPSGNNPCAYTCMDYTNVWLQVSWLCITCTRIIWILMAAVYKRARRQAAEREDADVAAQIAALDAAQVHNNNNEHVRRPSAVCYKDRPQRFLKWSFFACN
jgi:hypothetical protein